MSCSTQVEVVGADAIVVRRAAGADDVARLRESGERLRAAAHPGVVELLSSTGDRDAWELRLVHAGRSVDVGGPWPVERVAGIAAAVAGTLADLHRDGIVHGRIDGSHVLIGRDGRPVLCGFAPAADPPPSAEDDVAGVGALIVSLLGPDHDVEPIPDRRWHRAGSWGGWARRSLLMVADQACVEPPSRRPSARRLADDISDAVPSAAARGAVASPDAAGHPVRLGAMLAAAGAVLALAGGAVQLAQPVLRPSSRVAHALRSTSSTSQPAAQPTAPPTTTAESTTTTAPERVTSVSYGGRRYEVGQRGDIVVVGDWDGDGTATPAVLRPSTGEVFVFDAWTPDSDVAVGPVAVVAGATDLLVVPRGGRDDLAAQLADGSTRAVLPVGST